jgi:cobalt-zinc-cadmium efflux system outer membrane protein
MNFGNQLRQFASILAAAACLAAPGRAQTVLNWSQVQQRFLAANPNLRAGQLNIDESKAAEITAYLRPNPDFSIGVDQLQFFTDHPYRPLTAAFPSYSFDYLHERQHKRELRLQSAKDATSIAVSQQDDLIRNLTFNLRNAFVQTLQAKAVLALAKENLDYFDREATISRERLRAGDIAQLDLNRIDLQRVQYESDFQAATVTLRTAKIQLLQLMNDRSPIASFDISGAFDFSEALAALEEYRAQAAAARPDLQAAVDTVVKARTDHKLAVANGSTDPTFSLDVAHNPPFNLYIGFSINIPLRIFDRNQGEKLRTEIDIAHSERARQAAEAQVYSDVDSAYATIESSIALLKPYRDKYLKLARDVRDTTEYSYQRGQAALVDYLDAQRDYRATYVAYLNLIGSYLNAASQLNLAVGREVIPIK